MDSHDIEIWIVVDDDDDDDGVTDLVEEMIVDC